MPAPGSCSLYGAVYDVEGPPSDLTWPGVSSLPNFKVCDRLRLDAFKVLGAYSQGPYGHITPQGLPPLKLSPAGLELLLVRVVHKSSLSSSHFPGLCMTDIQAMLQCVPERRISASSAMEHPYFDSARS
jgi:hypothetical protein